MNSKYPHLNPEWIPILRELYQPLRYDETMTTDEFIRRAAYTAGQISLIDKLESIVKLQQKENLK
jgi:hypothetical protein